MHMNPHNTIPNNLVGFVEIQSMQPKASLNSTWLLHNHVLFKLSFDINIITTDFCP